MEAHLSQKMQNAKNSRLITLLLFLFACIFTNEVYSQSRIDDLEQLKLDVERALRPDQFKSLLIGSNETVVVINESNLALSKGAAVLVSETGRNGASQLALAPLSPYLNDFGWTTIMVTAPKLDFELDLDEMQDAASGTAENQASENAAETAADGGTSSDGMASAQDPNDLPPPNQLIPSYTSTPIITENMFQQQEQSFQLLMNAIESERENYPGFFLLVAQGTSAAWLAKMYTETNTPPPDAVVTLGVNWPQQDLNQQVPEIIAQTPFPVLDIFNQFDSEWAVKTANDRRIAAVKSLKLHFRQREIIGPRYDHSQYEYLSREIHGWLTYMGW